MLAGAPRGKEFYRAPVWFQCFLGFCLERCANQWALPSFGFRRSASRLAGAGVVPVGEVSPSQQAHAHDAILALTHGDAAEAPFSKSSWRGKKTARPKWKSKRILSGKIFNPPFLRKRIKMFW